MRTKTWEGDPGNSHPGKVESTQGTIGCTPNNVSMVFIGFSRDSWGLEPINTHVT